MNSQKVCYYWKESCEQEKKDQLSIHENLWKHIKKWNIYIYIYVYIFFLLDIIPCCFMTIHLVRFIQNNGILNFQLDIKFSVGNVNRKLRRNKHNLAFLLPPKIPYVCHWAVDSWDPKISGHLVLFSPKPNDNFHLCPTRDKFYALLWVEKKSH